MYNSFRIENFRCFKSLELEEIKSVNLIGGKNNSGKTVILEALFLHGGAYNPDLTLRINTFRGFGVVDVDFKNLEVSPWDSMFHNFDNTKEISLDATFKDLNFRQVHFRVIRDRNELLQIENLISKFDPGEKDFNLAPGLAEVLEVESVEQDQEETFYMIFDQKGKRIRPYPKSLPFPIVFEHCKLSASTELKELSERFSSLQIDKQENVLINALKTIEPRLKDITVVQLGKEGFLFGDIGAKKRVPLHLMGAGMVNLANYVLAIWSASNGVVLIDELENGFHHSVLPDVWKIIKKTAKKFNTQVFVATHSFENIMAAHNTFSKDKKYDFKFYRIEQGKLESRAVGYSQTTLELAIKNKFEVR